MLARSCFRSSAAWQRPIQHCGTRWSSRRWRCHRCATSSCRGVQSSSHPLVRSKCVHSAQQHHASVRSLQWQSAAAAGTRPPADGAKLANGQFRPRLEGAVGWDGCLRANPLYLMWVRRKLTARGSRRHPFVGRAAVSAGPPRWSHAVRTSFCTIASHRRASNCTACSSQFGCHVQADAARSVPGLPNPATARPQGQFLGALPQLPSQPKGERCRECAVCIACLTPPLVAAYKTLNVCRFGAEAARL